ncbi:hypothetical protein DAI22_02g171600 [Oryza sativa Japonica Group]|nr:hypothetical protein DAI22_02g171600 [Oryza sativa Japonica Group]
MTSPAHGGSFRVLRTAHVAPSSSAGAGCNPLPEATQPLTFLDAIWLIRPPVERVFFYRLGDGGGATCDVDVALSRLVDSLARALHVFYPLAGRLRLTPGKANRYELFYQPGDAVAFTVAEHDVVSLDELATDVRREVSKIAPLVPELPDGGAVLAVQATVLLPACRALAPGVTVHHAACDGASSTHFLHTWAAICAGAAATPPPPVIDRTSIREREDIHDVMTARLHDHLLATFTLSRENLQSIKERIADVATRRGVPPPWCTSVVATFAVIWRCHVRAALGAGCDVEEEPRNHGRRAHLLFVTDLRSRMEPRVPDKYLGNYVGPCFASAPRTDIAAAGADGLFAACSAIAAAVDEGTRYDPGYWDRYREQSLEVSTSGAPPLSVAGSPRFRVYDVDFGFGRPAKVGIALPPERMERFRRCFGEDVAIAWPSS